MQELNRILHQPIRTQIMAYLITFDSCDFINLKKRFNLSDGHMTTHMRELLSHEYVEAEKIIEDKKSRTLYRITQKGRSAFTEYVTILRQVINTI
jgi:DNA-binding MarR family transcriptional regulator